ncbi:SRPBCC family protein [Flavobacterium sp. H122]|uniref:SRPBCC family protein n=1 Tax=Flavobacterium sp. H122 TaxID=2529860 RepID=UPI0010AACB6B|nr:SRPBCC family protein [Flavobacterium sp. H122]
MISIQSTYQLDHPVQVVFDYINEPQNEPLWISSVTKIDHVEGDLFQIHYDFLGKKEMFLIEITTEEYKTRTYKRIEGVFPMRGHQVFTPIKNGEGTQIEWLFEIDPGKFFGIIPHIIIKKAVENMMKKDVKKLNDHLLQVPQTT